MPNRQDKPMSGEIQPELFRSDTPFIYKSPVFTESHVRGQLTGSHWDCCRFNINAGENHLHYNTPRFQGPYFGKDLVCFESGHILDKTYRVNAKFKDSLWLDELLWASRSSGEEWWWDFIVGTWGKYLEILYVLWICIYSNCVYWCEEKITMVFIYLLL